MIDSNPNPLVVVVNADDFGSSASVNRAISDAFRLGLISSTTMMTNMPGFEDACEIARIYKFQDCIGIHLNLIEGQPVSEDIRSCRRFCDASGFFNGFLEGRHYGLSPDERKAVATELGAQIDLLEMRGIVPTHMDSHHHLHTSIALLPVFIQLARKRGISAIRINGNCCKRITPFYQKAYKIFYNTVLYLFGKAKTDYFCPMDDSDRVCRLLRNGRLEIMVHPTFSHDGVLVDAESMQPLSEQLKPVRQCSKASFSVITKSRWPKLLILDGRGHLL